MSINRVVLSGNLTRDPDLRSTAGGTSVLGFGIAVNDRRKNNQTGEWEDVPNFIDCTMFGNRADAVGKFLAKGMKVAIEGKLRWSQWERDGQKRSKIEVIVDELVLMQQKQDGGRQQPALAPQQPAYTTQYPQANQGYQKPGNYLPQAAYAPPQGYQQQPVLYDEDIPF